MITHTFFEKCNTIIKDSELNTGLNPIAELNAGGVISRILIYFDLTKLRNKVKNGEVDVNNLTHKIKMTNCGSVTLPIFNNKSFVSQQEKTRAASFDVIAFKIPFAWDEGRGFDYQMGFGKDTHKITSTDCCNWYQARNFVEWDEYGVYSNDALLEDYNKEVRDIIIGEQHFDNGTESLDLDITEYINDILLNNKEFHGIALAFSPIYEYNTADNTYISFFTHRTNTFFAPYLETINSNDILDDRAKFHIGVKNHLYLFVNDNGEYVNLDFLPTCKVEGQDYEVKQCGKGIYYIEIHIKNGDVEPNTILYDTWSNIVLNGEEMNDVEMEFVVLPIEKRINIGRDNSKNETSFSPQLSGIYHKENVAVGDIREINVDFIEDYSYGTKIIPNKCEYRVYIKEHSNEIDIYPYQTIERHYDKHVFLIDSNELIPHEYYIDIRVKYGRNVKIFKDALVFSISNNTTNIYK